MLLEQQFPHRVVLSLAEREDRRALLRQELARIRLSVEWCRPLSAADMKGSSRSFKTLGRRALTVTRRLLLRHAAHFRKPSLLILEDDVKFHPEFRQRLAKLELPDDWGLFYFGCLHFSPPIMTAQPGLVRITEAYDCHAVAIRDKHFLAARRTMRGGGKQAPCTTGYGAGDVMLAELQKTVPAYAAWPNLAWQRKSHSTLAGLTYCNYDEQGCQTIFLQGLPGPKN